MKTNLALGTSMLVYSLLLASGNALAHCDTLDGPVARAAHAALDTGNVNVALIWVNEEDEMELRQAFASAQAVRKLSAPTATSLKRWRACTAWKRAHPILACSRRSLNSAPTPRTSRWNWNRWSRCYSL